MLSFVEHNGEMIKSEPLHGKANENEIITREPEDFKDSTRKSKLARSRTSAKSMKKDWDNRRESYRSVPTTPMDKSLDSVVWPQQEPRLSRTVFTRKGSLDAEIGVTEEQLHHLMQIQAGHEIMLGADIPISEEQEESQKTLSSKEGKRLAEEFAAHSRQNNQYK